MDILLRVGRMILLIIAGVATGSMAFSFFRTDPIFFLIGQIGLVLYTFASPAIGYLFMKPKSNMGIVGIFMALITLCASLVMILVSGYSFRPALLDSYAGVVTIGFFASALGGISIQRRERSAINSTKKVKGKK